VSAPPGRQGAALAPSAPAVLGEEFREQLLAALGSTLGRLPDDVVVERSAPPRSGSYRAELVTVRPEGEPAVRVFLKDFGECKHEKDGMRARRERELHVYRDLLAHVDLDTPRYLGASWDPSRDHFWLLLEYVEGKPLRHLGFEYWLAAAGWLGRMRAHLPRPDPRSNTHLVEHDASFFAGVARRALPAVCEAFPGHGERVRTILREYDAHIPHLGAQPRYLVHGHYRPYNIVVSHDSGRARLCVTDWEEAALGSPLYDLAYLSDGFDPRRLDELVDAYEAELAKTATASPDRAETLRLIRCLHVHRNLKTLAKADSPGFSEEGVEKLVSRSEEIVRGLA